MRATTRRVAIVAAAGFLLSVGSGADAEMRGCMPPGIAAEVFSWQTVQAKTVTLTTESGDRRAGLMEVYGAPDGRAVVVVWVRGAMVYVDAAPENPRSPAWVDRSVMSAEGDTLRDRPEAACHWQTASAVRPSTF